MKRLLMGVILVSLVVMAAPTRAQDAADCGAAAIKSRMDALIATYDAAQADAVGASDSLAAAQALQDAIDALTTGCASPAAEATATPATPAAASNGMPIEGKWMLTWLQKTKSCAADNYVANLDNRPVQVRVSEDGKDLLLNDLFWLRQATFEGDGAGQYTYIRNAGAGSNTPFTFTYVLSNLKSDVMDGSSSDYIPRLSCQRLQGDFTLTLVDADVICMVGSDRAANLRSGPGTTFERAGTLAAGKGVDVVGYATGSDQSKWWKLASGGWIRSDLVREAGRCEDVPEASG